ncbi:uncharacterized protein LOC117941262 [Etheostoma cragini]|uniref:uncharacterized protein LOC117941262 n=1 Tax=Etheostoma cragini TaxID=417921 RepID=UPI00155EB0B9|nr:uncharacterized protein LOC117941262 [Etheostoma cragini]
MGTAALLFFGLVFICCQFTEISSAEEDSVVESECRDRYFWIHVRSAQTPRFQVKDGSGVHVLIEPLASRCGYTISTFRMDGFTTFRASYYSCFTQNQNDEMFTFSFNVSVSNAGGTWTSRPVSAVCSGLTWTHREVICEEDYMEVNVDRESSCGGQRGDSGEMWHSAFSQAQRMASSVWQLMFLQSDGRVSSMSISEAQRGGYSLTVGAQRVALRSRYKQPHAELRTVEGVPVEVVRVSLFFKKKLTLMMIDVSMACTVNSGSYDGARLLWDIPRVVTPLVDEGALFESRTLGLGLEGVLLDEHTIVTRGFSMVQRGPLVQIGVPFGAEGGYRKSSVVNNVYKETYVIFMLYEHVFSLLYEDGSSIDTRHRMLRVLDTPLLCRPPFHLDKTVSDDRMFRVYLGNIPADVTLEDVHINGNQMMMSQSTKGGFSISPVLHANGSRAYELQMPFENGVVRWTYVGQGVVQYSIDVNYTLTIMSQKDSYYHLTSIKAQAVNMFPPEITAQCSDGGITFTVVIPSHAESIWEVGVGHEPLTSQLAIQRGYRLHSEAFKTTLEIPVFSVGYAYDDVTLSNFYGTFRLLLRDSKTLEVQTSTSKRCLFKTKDMIVCSADGTMAVVTTPTSTWPSVHPDTTTLLDPSCKPKETDAARVLFVFKLDSCGTRALAAESYMVYENEIVHDRQLISDGPNLISRESQFKLTVRCFYPLGSVNRLSVNRSFRSEMQGFGSIKVFKSLTGSNQVPAEDCSRQVSGNVPTNKVHQAEGVLPLPSNLPRPKPGPSHFIMVPGGPNKLLSVSQKLPNPHLSPPETISTQNQQVFGFSDLPPHGPPQYELSKPLPPSYNPDPSAQLSKPRHPSSNFVQARHENSGPTNKNLAFGLSSSRIPDSPVGGELDAGQGRSGPTGTPQDAKSLGMGWHSGLSGDKLIRVPGGIIEPHEDQQSLKLTPGVQDWIRQHKNPLEQSLSAAGQEVSNAKEKAVNQPQSQNHWFQTSQLHPAPFSTKLPNVDTKHPGAANVPASETTSAATGRVDPNLEGPGTVERRETDRSRVQTIRVKPPSSFFPSGLQVNQQEVGHLYPNQEKRVQSIPEMGNWRGQESSQRKVPQTGSDENLIIIFIS